jgi:hypothetical protein
LKNVVTLGGRVCAKKLHTSEYLDAFEEYSSRLYFC